MVVYYHPVEDIVNGTVGEFISASSYDEAIQQLPHGHYLYALYGGLLWEIASYVDGKSEFDEIFYRFSDMITFKLVALPEAEHKKALADARFLR